MRYSLISLISYLIILIFGLWFISLEADDNTINIQTKGSDTNIGIDQSGSSNTTTVWCGLSNGTYTTHNCSNATITIDQHGSGNLAKAYSQVSNHIDNQYIINQNGNNNTGYLDLDDDDNIATIVSDR